MPSSSDEHWAPDHLVLARRVLSYAGRLLAERDDMGDVVTHAPLEGMAAVEHRYPAWARGPFGQVDTERDLPGAPGVFAVVQGGAARYVGASNNLARTFGPHGLGEISRREAQQAKNEERCRLNRLIVAEARAGRTVELYVLVLRRRRPFGRADVESPRAVADEILRSHRGTWHLPT